MYELIYDESAVFAKLNKTFADLGLPIKVEDYFDREMRCVAIVTNDNDLDKVINVLRREDIVLSVYTQATGLDWIPFINYVSTAKRDVMKALSLLESIQTEKRDVSDYLLHLYKSQAPVVGFFALFGLLIYGSFAVGLCVLSLQMFYVRRWIAAFLFAAFSVLFAAISFLVLRGLWRSRQEEGKEPIESKNL